MRLPTSRSVDLRAADLTFDRERVGFVGSWRERALNTASATHPKSNLPSVPVLAD